MDFEVFNPIGWPGFIPKVSNTVTISISILVCLKWLALVSNYLTAAKSFCTVATAATFASPVILFDPRLPRTERDRLRFWGVLSATSAELPGAQLLGILPPARPFSFHSPHFIFVSIWHWNVIQLAQRAVRSARDSFKANSEMWSCPLLLLSPRTLISQLSKGVFFFFFWQFHEFKRNHFNTQV